MRNFIVGRLNETFSCVAQEWGGELEIHSDQGRCDLLTLFFFHDLLVDCIDVLCSRVRGAWQESTFFTNRIFVLWSKAEMSLSHNPALVFFWSFWMNVNGGGCASASKHESNQFHLFALICLSHFYTYFLRLSLHQDKDSVLCYFFFLNWLI